MKEKSHRLAGMAYGGGYCAGASIVVDGVEYALIIAPKSLGDRNDNITGVSSSSNPIGNQYTPP